MIVGDSYPRSSLNLDPGAGPLCPALTCEPTNPPNGKEITPSDTAGGSCVTIVIPKPSKKSVTVQKVQIVSSTTAPPKPLQAGIETSAKDPSSAHVPSTQVKAGLVSLVVGGDVGESGVVSVGAHQSTSFPQRPFRKRVDSNPLPDQLLLSRHRNRIESMEGESSGLAELSVTGSPTSGRRQSSATHENQNSDQFGGSSQSGPANPDPVLLRNNNWEIPHKKAEKHRPVQESSVFSFTLVPAFPSQTVHAGKSINFAGSGKKNEFRHTNPSAANDSPRPFTSVVANTPALTAPAPQQMSSPPAGSLDSATTALLLDPFPETSALSNSNKIKVTIPLPTPLRFNMQSLSYDTSASASSSSRVRSGGDTAAPSMDSSEDPIAAEASFRQHVLGDDYLMQLRFLSSQKADTEPPRSISGKISSPRRPQAPSDGAQASYKRQELVMPTIPTSHRPSPQHKGMGAVTRRNLALRAASHLHAPQALQAAPVGQGPFSSESLEQGSVSTFMKRSIVSDSLNGTRTAAVKGGLFEQNDFFELLQASTEVSAAINLHSEEEIPSMITRLSPGVRETKPQVRIGRPLQEESASPERVLDPATLAAIEAAKRSADAARMPHVMTPASALEAYRHLLTEAEQAEILHFPRVYFLGLSAELKVRVGGHPDVNNGYDYKDGLYITHFGDHLRYRYEILSTLGKGSFGKVYRCRDYKLGIDVAVKVIKNLPIFNDQAALELQALKALLPSSPDTPDFAGPGAAASAKIHSASSGAAGDTRHHHFMVQLVDSFEFRAHKCFVFPVFGKNLYEYMRDKDFAGLPMSFVKKVARQLLAALLHLRSLDVLHCDIKPENILLRDEATAGVVLIDFGSSCRSTETAFTYIQSRFYRSPEVLLGMPYGFNIDLWSVATILPELRTSYPAFPGESGADQLACISDVLGLPPASMCERCTRKERFFDAAGVLQIAPSPRGMARLPNSRSLDMITNARRKDADFVDFLSKSLRWEPETRLPLEDCLAHPWLCEQTAQGSHTLPDSTPSTQLASRVETPVRTDSATLQDEEETAQFTVSAPVVSHLSMHRPDPMKGISDDDVVRKIKMSTSKAVQEVQEDELGRKLAQLMG